MFMPHVLLVNEIEVLLVKVQEYVDGEFLYIPRSSDNKRSWGGGYFLFLKNIQRIIGQLKKEFDK